MKARRRIPATALIAALCTVAGSAFAGHALEIDRTVTFDDTPVVTTYRYDPVTDTYYYYTTESPPAITITAPRLTDDEAITHDVMGVLASDPRLEGHIGVETDRREVTLSGRVGTQRQIDIAATHAVNVPGVREVHNLLRPQVGPVS